MKDLRQEDIMLKDWVLQEWHNNDGTTTFTKVRVDSIMFEMPWLMCKPMPLTPEMMEMNGFRKGSYIGGYIREDFILRVYLSDEETRFGCIMDDDIVFMCRYVHELQHLLRLCGLEELAETFKVGD